MLKRACLIVVACEMIALTGCASEQAPPFDDAVVIEFDDRTLDELYDPERIVQVDIRMDEDDFDALRTQARTFASVFGGEDCRDRPFESPYTYFHAAIEVDGVELPDVGIRKKGFIGSQSVDKPGFRINLDEFVDGAQLYGTDNLTLNNGVQDPALIRQCLTYKVYRDAGYPAPRCNFAHVSMNGEDLGVYVNVEPVKRRFLRQHFPTDDGDLYEGTISDFVPGWEDTFEPKNYDTDPTLEAIRDITARLDVGQDPAEVLELYFDIDAMLTHFALEAIVGHWDGYVGNRNNFYIYRDPTTDLFTFLPWGTDGTMRNGRAGEPLMGNGILAASVFRDPLLADRFQRRVDQLLDDVFRADELNTEIDRMLELIGDRAEFEPEAIENLRRFIDRRPDELRDGEWRPTDPQPPFCMIEQGSIGATFETTWGSIGAGGDLTMIGTVDLDLVTDDGPLVPARAGVVAGLTAEGAPVLAIIALVDPPTGALLIWYVGTDPEVVQPGVTLRVGGFGGAASGPRTEGGVLFTNNDIGELVPAGFMQGEITFDEFGTDDGATVSGRLDSVVLNWAEVEP